MECDVRFAWDDEFLYVLVQQTAAAARVHEAENVTRYSSAVWDFDGAWLYFDLGNRRLPSIGDFILSLAFNSNAAQEVYYAPAAGDGKAARIHVATSGSAADGNRIIEARIAWAGLIQHAFNGSEALAKRFGAIQPGLRFGCEPLLMEYNHTGQSFIGGAQYTRPKGFDANSRDIVLQASGRTR
jgi:hypothetical protein